MSRKMKLVATLLLVGGVVAWWVFWGPCGLRRTSPAIAALKAHYELWSDAMRLASSTPRIALSGPVRELQSIRHAAAKIKVPGCLEQAKSEFESAADLSVEAFLLFMRDTNADPEIGELSARSLSHMNLALAITNSVDKCSPFCGSAEGIAVRAKNEADPYKLTKSWKELRGDNLSLAMQALGAPTNQECWWMEARLGTKSSEIQVRCMLHDKQVFFVIDREKKSTSAPLSEEPSN